MTTVQEAWAAVMQEVRGLGKHQANTAPGGGYSFRGIDAVMNAVGPALRNHGVIIIPQLEKVTRGTTTTSRGILMTTIDVEVTYTIVGPAGDTIVTRTPGEAFDSGDKATSKAMSVAYRTMLLQSLCLPTDEPDPDASTYEQVNPQQFLQDAKTRAWLASADPDRNRDTRTQLITAALADRGLNYDTATPADWDAVAEEFAK